MPATQPASTLPAELHVAGNQLQTSDGRSVWLQGLCVDSLEWSAKGTSILQSIPVAIDQWHSNVIRLPVDESILVRLGKMAKEGRLWNDLSENRGRLRSMSVPAAAPIWFSINASFRLPDADSTPPSGRTPPSDIATIPG